MLWGGGRSILELKLKKQSRIFVKADKGEVERHGDIEDEANFIVSYHKVASLNIDFIVLENPWKRCNYSEKSGRQQRFNEGQKYIKINVLHMETY